MDQFEQAFDAFLQSRQADLLYHDYFMALRQAFSAGYRCAGGEIPQSCPVIYLPGCRHREPQ